MPSLVEIVKAMKMPDGSWLRTRAIKGIQGENRIEAMHRGRNVGVLRLRRAGDSHPAVKEYGPGHVAWVEVAPSHQRKGIGTKMWDRAESSGMTPYHSDNLSSSGESYRRSVGGRAMPIRTREEREADILHHVTEGRQGKKLVPKPLEVLPRRGRH